MYSIDWLKVFSHSSRTAADTRTFVRFGAENVELVDGQKETAWIAGGGVSFQIGEA